MSFSEGTARSSSARVSHLRTSSCRTSSGVFINDPAVFIRGIGEATNYVFALFESLGVDVFRGQAKFRSANEVEVDGAILRAKNFVIAAGSRAAIPKVEGIESVPYFTNETIFDELNLKPASMIVLGGGPIGCELGQTFGRLGVQVTIMQRGSRRVVPCIPLRSTGSNGSLRLSLGCQRTNLRDCPRVQPCRSCSNGLAADVSLNFECDALTLAQAAS